MTETMITKEIIQKTHQQLLQDAKQTGYHLNPDTDFVQDLIHGLLTNEKRYGYWACPCRLPSGNKKDDLDIICPCDYRDPDLNDYGACYCALYVSQEIYQGKKIAGSIPERRPPPEQRAQSPQKTLQSTRPPTPKLPVWRCRVCGYLCAREDPPEICPICKAKKERFEQFFLK